MPYDLSLLNRRPGTTERASGNGATEPLGNKGGNPTYEVPLRDASDKVSIVNGVRVIPVKSKLMVHWEKQTSDAAIKRTRERYLAVFMSSSWRKERIPATGSCKPGRRS